MELGFLILFGLTITSSTGFSLSISRPLLPLGGGGGSSSRRPGMRFPGIQERDGEEAETVAAGRLLPGVSGSDTSVKKVADPEELHHRTKRCTCYTYRDKECVYYCHLDIIWINTPERTVPYGLANYRGSFRGKRSTEQHHKSVRSSKWPPSRCSCADRCDKHCMHFCARSEGSQYNKEQLNSTADAKSHRGSIVTQ